MDRVKEKPPAWINARGNYYHIVLPTKFHISNCLSHPRNIRILNHPEIKNQNFKPYDIFLIS